MENGKTHERGLPLDLSVELFLVIWNATKAVSIAQTEFRAYVRACIEILPSSIKQIFGTRARLKYEDDIFVNGTNGHPQI
jgi:hypothetical protein